MSSVRKLKEGVYSVGVIDGDIRMFHGYLTPIGSSYNAYLVVDDQVTLVDFVKRPFADQFLSNIREVIADRSIDNIIVNHVEPDHSGALPVVVEAYPDAKLFGTAACQRELAIYYPEATYTFEVVAAGGTLQTGDLTFHFVPMPMVHWPDSMSTYLPARKLLFSNDALGQHIGSGEQIDTELELDSLMERASDYYANIVMPFGMQVTKLLGQVSELDVDMVCPSHGVVLTRFIGPMVEAYARWAAQEVNENQVTIVYDTMWGTTEKLANILRAEHESAGRCVTMFNLAQTHYSTAVAQLLESKYILIGSPTLNNQMLPSMAAFVTYLKGLKPKNRTIQAFGSYGWSGESVKYIHEAFESAGFEMIEPLKTQWNV